MNNLSGFLAALIAGIMVLAHRSDDFSTLRRHRSQKYRVHFFKDPAGKYVSFINLKATFNDPDVVDIEPEKKRFLDFDDDKISDDWTIIVITPAPLLETLPTPDQMVSTVSIFKSKAATTTPRVHPDPTIPELPSTSTAFPREEPDYPVNDRIPGIEYLKPIKIPHKIRHHKLQNGERLRADVSIPTASHVPRLETGQLPSDDEDYVFTKHEASSIISLTSTSRVLADTDLPTTSYSSLTTSVSIFETTLSSLLEDSTGDIADTTAYFSIYATSEASMSTSTEMLNTTSFNDTYFYEDWAVVNETQISPKEVLHEDPLGRNETELKELLTNLSYLEQDEDGVSHQDYGASFLVPVLKRVDYDNNSVPLVFQDVPVNVKISLNIIHLANFDSQQMEYTIDLEMKMSWFDIRLANNYTKPIRIREKFILDQIWRPDPYFVNSKYSYFHMVSFPNFRMRIKPNGLVTYALRVTLLPACQMIFCRFPHDSQQCDLLISSIAYPQSNVNLSWYISPVQFASKISLPELRVKSLNQEECKVEGKLISSSCLRLVFSLERDGARYIVEKYIPSTLAMMFAWVAPYVPYNYEDVRIITPITVLLTLVQMEKGDMVVRTSYLTSMDRWFAAMKAFSVLSLIESLVVLALIKRSRGMEKQALRAITEYEKDFYQSEGKRLTGLYHRVDSAARFLSPVFFILYFVYYVLYVAQGDERHCITESIFKQENGTS